MILLPLYCELIGLQATLVPFLAPFAKTSNNQIPVVEVLLVLRYGLALGVNRLIVSPAIVAIITSVDAGLLSVSIAPRVRYRRLTEVLEGLHIMRSILLGHSLDLGSAVFCR